jgi:peptide/nickel transport system permease protein
MADRKYILNRIFQTIFMLWFVLTFLFVLFRLMPGSYADIMLAQGGSQESIEFFREKWGLNDPLHVQYLNYIQNLVRFDAGQSLQFRSPVWEIVRGRILNTFVLIAPATIVSYLIAISIGSIMGTNRGSTLERYGTIPFIAGGMTPEFFTSILLIVVFASWLNLFPTSGIISGSKIGSYDNIWEMYFSLDFAKHFVLPFTAGVLRQTLAPLLMMRTSVVEVLGQDFIYYHRMTGIPRFRRLRQIGKHSILPVMTLFPISMAKALSGLVLIEMVFNWPGIGFTLVEAIMNRDLPVVQFVFFIAAGFVIIMNLIIDLLYGTVDPRVDVGSEETT